MARRDYEVSHSMHSELQQKNTDWDRKERVMAVTVVPTILERGRLI
jgi:hypothetical protein